MHNLSIVVPVYNEIKFLPKLFLEIEEKFKNYEKIEVIFVNDGSTDGSKEVLLNLINKYNSNILKQVINLDKNYGKGKAVREGIKISKGNYILLLDSDLELDMIDAKEIYQITNENQDIKCIFGTRYLSGKLKKNKYFMNELVVKLNTMLFNILFSQSLSDVHCGLKIISREILDQIKLTANDFGLEMDIASQIAKKNYFIYEYGISYYSRTVEEGKKITLIDGIKSYYYLIKFRFFDNDLPTLLSVIYSFSYMFYVGTYFGMGNGKLLFVIIFSLYGLWIGLKRKIFSSSIVFLFIYIGSLFGEGQGQVVSVTLFFLLGLYLSSIISKRMKKIAKYKLSYMF